MYCQDCGAETIQGLKYCKQCGANLSPSRPVISFNRITGMFWAIAVFAIGSLALLIGGAVAVTALGQGGSDVAAVVVIGLMVVLVIAILLVTQLSRIISTVQKSERAEAGGKTRAVKERDTAPELAAPPLSVPSVTEHTTRNFDAVLNREKGGQE